uniref:DNA topoisomerase (ATP-hydrolyzing) n=2 Tax=Mycoplasmopsis synoviae TaxID=2109 RepID=A0A385GIN1_MYCSY|nr:DNA topoisomerase II subunit B [Mycoplasmopsis synoviae]AXX39219.1 DNA topoisomerase II subunit B [Mycoplasmopsis synoviae]AXX39220.1 DNA topoisomerase II subunit B [Mycoplasmopsis synoviae]AXX39221.1 DNA topoisomerase II subunit B [Mycoplasmopsis synoviae]AXX39222.1 DNA topoisomerase II subunit B [Mycoplasmopsis synoviae]
MEDKNKVKNNAEYNADSIEVLEGLEAVRMRPGMYIGSKDKTGLHHLIWEIVDNSVDEVLAGYADNIKITITKDGGVSVEDNGRGIPVDMHSKGKSALEIVFTGLHAGGKFKSDAYKVSGGLHGVGASVVNGLSSYLGVWVKRNGNVYFAEFKDGGKIEAPIKVIGTTGDNKTGTKVLFYPDFTIMDKNEFDKNLIVDRIRQTAYLNKNLRISLSDERDNSFVEFCYPNGILDFLNVITKSKNTLQNDELIYTEGTYQDKTGDVKVEIAMRYMASAAKSNAVAYAYTNNIYNKEGGTHLNGFFNGLTRIWNNYAQDKKFFKTQGEKFSREDLENNLFLIISIKHNNPEFEGQTKHKLNSRNASPAVNKVFSEVFEKTLDQNPKFAEEVIKYLLDFKARRLKDEKEKELQKKKGLGNSSLPGKLSDCSSKNAEESELYIVEGNSAGGSAKMGRDRHFQAILPLKGKILNVEKKDIEKILKNDEILSLIAALGAGVGQDFNVNKVRYQKVIIMTDADSDGSHIRVLLITFFFKLFRQLIEYGMLYIAQPPLYKIESNKKVYYAYNEAQKEEILDSLDKSKKIMIQRYKGLGEMNADQLWETTMDPKTRKMLQVQVSDAEKAMEVLNILMGEETEPRKEFIFENAKKVRDIDWI